MPSDTDFTQPLDFSGAKGGRIVGPAGSAPHQDAVKALDTYSPRATNAGAQTLPAQKSGEDALSEAPLSGSINVGAAGLGTLIRVPVPGTGGLYVEFFGRGWMPKSGSTSTLFIQDTTGKKHLRLDYGYNVKSGNIDYHWNQKGTNAIFGIQDHAPAGRLGQGLYQFAKYFRYAGRVLVVAGVALDAYSIVVAEKRWRQVARVVSGWAAASAGCRLVGAGGAYVGTFFGPGPGNAVGGVVGCIAGGIGGYWLASSAAAATYDWVEETFFTPLPQLGPDAVGNPTGSGNPVTNPNSTKP